MSKKRKTNFRERTVNDAHNQKQKASSFGYLKLPKGTKIFSIKENTRAVELDIMPYEVTLGGHPDKDIAVGDLWYKRPFRVHRNIGADDKTVICLQSVGKKCPICEWVSDQRKKGAEWDDIKDVAARDRNLYVVIPLDNDDYDEVPHVWDMSQFLFQNELNDTLEENEEMGGFPDLEDGKTLEIKLKWKSLGKNSYPETRDISFLDREHKYEEDILDDIPALDELLDVKSYEELNGIFLEIEAEDTEAYTEEPTTKRERKSVRKTKDNEEPEKEERKSTRKRKEPDEEEEPKKEEEQESPKRGLRRREDKDEDDKGDRCPHGHTFGDDWDDKDECAKCKVWDACGDEYEKNKD